MAIFDNLGGYDIAASIASGDLREEIDLKADIDGYYAQLTAGAALGITGDGPTETATWLQRVSTSDGPTTIRSIHGNTIVQDGELLPVNMTGIESTGFNQWDEEWERGGIDPTTGQNVDGSVIRSKNYIPVFPETDYFFRIDMSSGNIAARFYDANKGYIGARQFDGTTVLYNRVFKTPANCHYMRFNTQADYGNTYNHDICINISDPTRNGTYVPYWQSERTIPAGTLRGAGSVYDEQTETERITRVGERAYQSGDESDPTVTTDGTITYYPLTTPTVTTYDPPLNLTYRTEVGGTERVMVPAGENSAPPTLVTAQGYTAESLRDAALSAIAPVENGKASTNYGAGSYLVHGGQLCKVTTAIATGEAISIGTNVTATTVMAEVIALAQ